MGLMYDPSRNLVWAVGQNSHVHVLRIRPENKALTCTGMNLGQTEIMRGDVAMKFTVPCSSSPSWPSVSADGFRGSSGAGRT